jgi:ADP-heptose:LPS heptosyltransferase
MSAALAAPQRILLIQLHHLGDVVLTTPAIRTARLAFPNARIDFLTGDLGAQALEGNPHLDSILVKPPLSRLRNQYDAVIDMHSTPRTALYTAVTRAATRAGIRGRGPRNLAYTHLLPRESRAVYMARQKLRLLEPLGVNVEKADLVLEIAIGEEQRRKARRILEEHKLTPPIVAVSPVAKHEFKQWGIGNFAAVVGAIGRLGVGVILTSGPDELEQAREVAEATDVSVVWNYGKTSVRELAALYEQCVLWIGNDGGPKHIATAARVPTVTVYRKTLGGVWSDPADPKQIAINSRRDTLDSIKPNDVIDAAMKLLP